MLKSAISSRDVMTVPKKPPQAFRFLTKMLLVMRLTILFLAIGLIHIHAEGLSQRINFSGTNVPLSKIFTTIEEQTGYTVFANKDLLRGVKPVTLSGKDMLLPDFLDAVFRNQPVTFQISNKTIFITRKPVSPAISSAIQAGLAALFFQEVTGTVTSTTGVPLEGATVQVKGTTTMVTTNAAGKFTVNAGADQVLVFSYIGYVSVEELVKNRHNINVALREAPKEMDQVVVTALGIKKQTKALTYNVQEVSGSELTRVKDASFVNSLSGKVAGITINSSSSGVGGSVRVVMRGTKSIVGNNNALYVVDGIPLPALSLSADQQPSNVFSGSNTTGDGITNINPEDIASVSVLTGPSAAALYGSQAANGVVLIITKKGTNGKLNVSLTNNTNFFSPFVMPRFQNTYGSDAGEYTSWGSKLATPGNYNPKDFFQTGANVTNSISVSTGNDKNQTYFSGAWLDAKGIIPNNKLGRYNFSVRNTATLIEDKLNLDINLMYVNTKEQNMISQGQYFNPLIPVYLFPRGDDIEKYQLYERYNTTRNFKTQFWPFGDLGFQMQNPYWIINRDLFNTQKERFMVSAGLKYTINSWMNVSGRVKIDRNQSMGERKFYASTAGLFASNTGAYYLDNGNTRQNYADVILSMNRTVHKDYALSANIGASITDDQYRSNNYGGFLLSVPNLFSYSNVNPTLATPSQSNPLHVQNQAVFANAQLGYRNMLFLDLTGRNDWSSTLVNTSTGSFFYPSIGVSGILSDLLHLRSRTLSFVKLRGTYSEVGNAPPSYVTIATNAIQGGFPVTTSYLPAENLQAERTKSYEVGLNMKFLQNKVNFDVTLYKSDTYNQLFNPTLAPSTGYSSFYINAGQISNKGIEALVSYTGKITRDLEWSSTATFTLNRNKVVQLLGSYTDRTTGQTVSLDSLSFGGTGSYLMSLVKGGSMGDIYVNTLETDEHGFIDVGLQTQNVSAAVNDYIKAGNANPRYLIGFRNSVSYKNFTLGFLVNARLGGVCVSVTQAIMDRFGVSEASAKARDEGGVLVNGTRLPAKAYYEVTGGGVAGVGSTYVYSATNVRLGEASLSYDFPAAFFHNKIQGITLSATGRNLFMFYNKAPFDPEAAASTGTYYQGIDYFMQPSLRSIGFSAKIKF
jgi:TonB-linked SusC/RagA family outer membrane protein